MLTRKGVETKGYIEESTYFIGPTEAVEVLTTPSAMRTRATSEKRAILFLLLTGWASLFCSCCASISSQQPTSAVKAIMFVHGALCRKEMFKLADTVTVPFPKIAKIRTTKNPKKITNKNME